MLRFSDYVGKITTSLHYHIENNIPLAENVYRVHSEEFYKLFREARELYNDNLLEVESEWDKALLESDIGEFGDYEGQQVPLDCPIQEEEKKDPPLNKPKKGGPKKFYVYVKNDKGNVIKVSFGDTTGLSIKRDDPERRKNFRARHNCDTAKDKTTARYWSCRMWTARTKVSDLD